MTMQLWPAIDLRGGQAVRLRQGDYAQETVFDADPVAVAQRWKDAGAEFLHLVDLDGAKAGRPMNTSVVGRIVQATGLICELGGGIRDEAAIQETLDLGVARVILGTKAVREPDWFAAIAQKFPGKIVLGVDARDGKVATAGWLEGSDRLAVDVVQAANSLPLAGVVFTDIAKDGMMAGPSFDQTVAIKKVSRHPVIASGGITTYDDLAQFAHFGLDGAILGRTLYEGAMNLSEALRRVRGGGKTDARPGSPES